MRDALAFLLGSRPQEGPPLRSVIHTFDTELSHERRVTGWAVSLEYPGLFRLTVPSAWCRVETENPAVVMLDEEGLLRARGIGRTTVRSDCMGHLSTAPITVVRRDRGSKPKPSAAL